VTGAAKTDTIAGPVNGVPSASDVMHVMELAQALQSVKVILAVGAVAGHGYQLSIGANGARNCPVCNVKGFREMAYQPFAGEGMEFVAHTRMIASFCGANH
jgi:hypothetical protein